MGSTRQAFESVDNTEMKALGDTAESQDDSGLF